MRKFTKYPSEPIKATTIKPKSSLSNVEYQRVKSQIEQGLPITQSEYDKLSLLEKDYSSAANAEMHKPVQRCDMGYAQFMRDNALEVKKLLETASVGVGASTSIMRKFTKYPSNVTAAEYGKAPTIPDDRFEFIVYDTYMYDDIMGAIDNVCDSTTGTLYSENFRIEGPYPERFDVVDILKDFGVDWEEV